VSATRYSLEGIKASIDPDGLFRAGHAIAA
jgi:hypothetical protein